MPRDLESAGPPLQMVQASVDARAMGQWMHTNGSGHRDEAIHRLLVESFGETAPRPFRLMAHRGNGGGKITLYGYGQHDAEELQDAMASYADPLQMRVIPPERIGSKAMPPAWRSGRTMGFEVRIRPVVRRKTDPDARGRASRNAELDAFRPQGNAGENGLDRAGTYVRWLGRQMARNGAAKLMEDKARIIHYEQSRAAKAPPDRAVIGPDVVVRGLIEIGNPESFQFMLARGIGRHRSFGYGMILLRPPV